MKPDGEIEPEVDFIPKGKRRYMFSFESAGIPYAVAVRADEAQAAWKKLKSYVMHSLVPAGEDLPASGFYLDVTVFEVNPDEPCPMVIPENDQGTRRVFFPKLEVG